MNDLRFGIRMLMKHPGLTSVALLALALGIGANTAIFSVVNSVLLKPLGYREPERLVWVWGTQPQLERAPHSPADFLDYQSQTTSFDQMAAFRFTSFTLTGDGQPETLDGLVTSANYFSTLGLNALYGQTFAPEDGAAGAARKAVLSYGLFQRRFGGDMSLIGKSITLNGESVSVIGVMPQSFSISRIELWLNPRQVVPDFLPSFAGDILAMRSTNYLNVVARLKPDATIEQAQAEITAIHKRIEEQYPSKAGHGVRLVSMHELVTGDVRPALLVLLGAVAMVLLIACANVANLMLARATARSKEMAVRTALGANRWRVIRQLLTESLLLALAGGALGWLLAVWGVEAMVALSPPDTPRLSEISLDRSVFLFTILVSLLTGIVFGIAPAISASKTDLNEALKDGGRSGTAGEARKSIRSALVVAEIAIALVVLIGAGLLAQSFARLLFVSPGFDARNLLTMSVWLADARYEKGAPRRQFMKDMVERLEQVPGVEGVAVCDDLPVLGTDTTSNPTIEGRPPFSPEDQVLVGRHVINSHYFEAMGISLLKGRAFTESDSETSQPVLVINESMARAFWPDEDAIGKRVSFNRDDKGQPVWSEIVGICADVKWDGLHQSAGLHSYSPYLQEPWPYLSVAVRSSLDPSSLIAAIRREVQSIDPNQAVSSVKMMDDAIRETVAPRRFSMALFGLFAVVALLLTGIGIYGVMSYTVTQRTHEIGVRLALGASRGDVLRLVLRQALKLTLIGTAIGLAAAFAATRFMESLLFEMSATDTMTFAAVSVMLAAVALGACFAPALRATRVDPMVALRYE